MKGRSMKKEKELSKIIRRMRKTEEWEGICLSGEQAKIVIDYIDELKRNSHEKEEKGDE